MESRGEHRSIEHDINDLRQSLDKYSADGSHPSAELVADLTNAVRRISDHLVAVHRRLQKLEDTQEKWTTRGLEAPPGADHSADEAA